MRTNPPHKESVRAHFFAGSIPKALGIGLQLVQAVWLAGLLGQERFGAYVALTTLSSLITCLGAAWSSAAQNPIVEELAIASRSRCEVVTVAMTALTSLMAAIALMFCARWLGSSFALFSVVSSAGGSETALFIFAVVVASVGQLSVSSLGARGQSEVLGRQQFTSKLTSLTLTGLVVLAQGTAFSPMSAFAAVQIGGFLLPVKSLLPGLHRIPWRGFFESTCQTLQVLGQYSAINAVVSAQRVIETNCFLAIGGLDLLAVVGIVQRLFSAVSNVFLAGMRNLWPFWRRTSRSDPRRVARSALKLRILGFAGFASITFVSLAFRDLLLAGIQFRNVSHWQVFVVLCAGSLSTFSSAVSNNVLYAFDRQFESLKGYVVSLVLTCLVWLSISRGIAPNLMILAGPHLLTAWIGLSAERKLLETAPSDAGTSKRS